MKTKKTNAQEVRENYIGRVKVESFNHNPELYTKLYLYLYGSVMKDYHVRKHDITFQFADGTNVTMKVRTAIINLIFWKPYIDFNVTIPLTALFDTATISENTIYDRLDDIITEFRNIAPIKELRKSLRHIIESLSLIPKHFAWKIGNSISMRDIIDLANDYPEFDAILHTHYPEGTPIPEIERDINVKNDRMVQIIKGDKTNGLHPFLCAGGNINLGQMAQSVVCIGPRSDIYGNVSPVIVNTNFVLGLRGPADYYLESFSSRKALIANKYQMSDSGYTTRQLSLLSMDSSLDDNLDDCGTTKTLRFRIPDAKTLAMLEYKNMVIGHDKKTGKVLYRQIDPKKDSHLIGTEVELRSHIFCKEHGNHYCKTCYGGLAYFNEGLHTNILAAVCLSEPIGQTVLSTKHLNKTHTKVVEWPDSIKKFFRTESDGLFINDEFCTAGVSIGFYTEDIDEYLSIFESSSMNISSESDEEDEESEDDSLMLDYVNRFVLNIQGTEIKFDDIENELYINYEFLQRLLKAEKVDDDVIWVSLDGFKASDPVFDLNIENMEIGEYLKRFMALLGVKAKTKYTTVEALLQSLCAAIVDLGLHINFALVESVVYNMIRDMNLIIDRPDFESEDTPYTIIPTRASILNSRSLTTSLSFERIKEQLGNIYTYMKSGKGFLDPFFK